MKNLSASYIGMFLAHSGIAVAIFGVVITTYYSEGKDVRMEPGDKLDLSGYQFEFFGSLRKGIYVLENSFVEFTKSIPKN